ncbi:MAG: pyrophosphatase [Saprospiraceae bacterium]|nr:pyrophosphatase [Saprospiraceae bacterium]HMW37948.1 MazG nucleotide pyrophosphohydrolase domain-containing protein [Saprospiraceae bacterium]HMX87622.1 MazG nucleotide pyrophosphohydrolase domain-containing protein [Saprospiraceae bacterium]HMZ39437.1 MazG nucleotide pyrophosphohydrolase domain-containing protein [Saprospiraceae bacterium]HNA63667.1 MazG nucleotide pyrophosphohydrolase domain-containing protein [Saprospiraceae bacterium]
MRQQQIEVRNWVQSIGKRYFDPLTNLGQLTEEVGELARILIREYGQQSWKKGSAPENVRQAIADELADIAFVVFCLSDQLDIDLEDAFKEKLRLKTDRDRERHMSNKKLD